MYVKNKEILLIIKELIIKKKRPKMDPESSSG
jgi:hypothetical protein